MSSGPWNKPFCSTSWGRQRWGLSPDVPAGRHMVLPLPYPVGSRETGKPRSQCRAMACLKPHFKADSSQFNQPSASQSSAAHLGFRTACGHRDAEVGQGPGLRENHSGEVQPGQKTVFVAAASSGQSMGSAAPSHSPCSRSPRRRFGRSPHGHSVLQPVRKRLCFVPQCTSALCKYWWDFS